jgi:hypothetical protein
LSSAIVSQVKRLNDIMNNQPSITKTRNLDGVGEKMKQIYSSSVQRNRLTFPHTGPRYSLNANSKSMEGKIDPVSMSHGKENPDKNEQSEENIPSEDKDSLSQEHSESNRTVDSSTRAMLRNRRSYISRTEMLASQQTSFPSVPSKQLSIHRRDEELVLLSREGGHLSPEGKIEVIEIFSAGTNFEDANQSVQEHH